MTKRNIRKKKKSKSGCSFFLLVSFFVFFGFSMFLLVYPDTRNAIRIGLYYLKNDPHKLFHEISRRLTSYTDYPYIPQSSNYYYGIDVSHYQTNINWENVRIKVSPDKTLPISFAYIKATEGISIIDRKYNKHRKEAEQAGIPTGSYHLFSLSSSAEDQFKSFKKVVKIKKGDLRPMFDIEEEVVANAKGSEVRTKSLCWLKLIEKEYGCRPILYMSQSTYKRFFQGHSDFARYDFWIARYNVVEPNVPYLIWQITDMGKVKGIFGFSDIDIVKNKTNFKKLFY